MSVSKNYKEYANIPLSGREGGEKKVADSREESKSLLLAHKVHKIKKKDEFQLKTYLKAIKEFDKKLRVKEPTISEEILQKKPVLKRFLPVIEEQNKIGKEEVKLTPITKLPLKRLIAKQKELLSSHTVDKTAKLSIQIANLLANSQGTDSFKDVDSAVTAILARYEVTPEEIAKEMRLLSSLGKEPKEELVKLRMVRRALLHEQNPLLAKQMERTGYSLSVVRAVDKVYRSIALGVNLEKYASRQIEGHVIIPIKQSSQFPMQDSTRPKYDVLVLENALGKGTSKIAMMSTLYWQKLPIVALIQLASPMLPPDRKIIASSSAEEVEDNEERDNESDEEESGSINLRPDLHRSVPPEEREAMREGKDVFFNAKDTKGGTKQELEQEISTALALQGKEGIFPTHSVTESASGDTVILQPLAGCAMEEGGKSIISFKNFIDEYDVSDPKYMQKTVEFLKNVVKGTGQLHALGYIHRDLKSENILFTSDGKACLSDFGTARKKNDPSCHSLAGSPYYMAPEVWCFEGEEKREGHKLDENVDIWSFGCMIYEALIKKAPPPLKKAPLPLHLAAEAVECPLEMVLSTPAAQETYELVCNKLNEYVENPNPNDKKSASFQKMMALCLECMKLDPKQRPSLDDIKNKLDAIGQIAKEEEKASNPTPIV